MRSWFDHDSACASKLGFSAAARTGVKLWIGLPARVRDLPIHFSRAKVHDILFGILANEGSY